MIARIRSLRPKKTNSLYAYISLVVGPKHMLFAVVFAASTPDAENKIVALFADEYNNERVVCANAYRIDLDKETYKQLDNIRIEDGFVMADAKR